MKPEPIYPLLRAADDSDATFRLPSTALFLGLMPIFSGLARRADLAATLDEAKKLDNRGDSKPAKVQTYIVHNSRETHAKISVSLFDNDPLWSEGELSALIKRQFGPAGLKHLLGVMIAAEEQTRSEMPGQFVFDASRHLDILGYKRSNRVNGKNYHTARHLREAREIVTLLCSLTIVQEVRLGAHRGATVKLRLLLDEASAESWEELVADGDRMKERIITNERLFIRFNPRLFMAAVEGTARTQLEYTHQLKKLSRENARTRGLVLTLGVHLPVKFRMNNCQPLELTARSFLRMAGIIEEEYTRATHLEHIENALRYMVAQGYINSFETERFRYCGNSRGSATANKKARPQLELKGGPAEHPEPLEEIWRVEPPDFLRELLRASPLANSRGKSGLKDLASTAAPKRTTFAEIFLPGMESGGTLPPTHQLLKQVRKSLNMQQADLARRLGVTQAAISMAEAGKRPRMALKFFEAARRILPGDTGLLPPEPGASETGLQP